MLSKEEECEAHYQVATKQLEDGRFELQLSFNVDPRKSLAPSRKLGILKYEAHERAT